MQIWRPPTPPNDDNDLYIDQTLCFLYEPSAMSESQLPPVYVKKDAKRQRMDVSFPRNRLKSWRDDQPYVPRSLFDRPLASLKRDAAKLKFGIKAPLKPPSVPSLAAPEAAADQPEWLVPEDWALLQAVQSLLGLPLSLQSNTPALIVNWDLVADLVNSLSRTYRSSKQCKNRYETVIIAREEGRILYDINPRKPKKTKGIYKTKNNRPMRTSQLFSQDAHNAITTLYTLRFDSCKAIAIKRPPVSKAPAASPPLKNLKHTAILAESGISYDQPLLPTQIAQLKADRLGKEKEKQKTAADVQQTQPQLQQPNAAGNQKSALPATMPIALPTVQQLTAVSLGSIAPSNIVTQQQLIVQVQQLQSLPAVAAASGAAAGSAVLPSGGLQKPVVASGLQSVANVTFSRGAASQGGSVVTNATASALALHKPFAPALSTTQPQSVSLVTSTNLANLVRGRVPLGSGQSLTVQQLTEAQARGLIGQVSGTQLIAPIQMSIDSPRAGAVQSLPASIAGIQLSQVAGKFTPQQLQSLQKNPTTILRQQQPVRQQRFPPASQAVGQVALQKSATLNASSGVATVVQSGAGPTVRLQVQKQSAQQLVKQAVGSESDLKQLQQQQALQQTVRVVSSASATPQLNTMAISHGSSLANAQTVATLIRAIGSQANALPSGISLAQQRPVSGRMTMPQVRTSQLQQRSVVTAKPIPQTAQRAGVTPAMRLQQGGTGQVVMPQQAMSKVMIQSTKPGTQQGVSVQQMAGLSSVSQTSLVVSKVSSLSTPLLSVVVSSSATGSHSTPAAGGASGMLNFSSSPSSALSAGVQQVGLPRAAVMQEGVRRAQPSVRLPVASATVLSGQLGVRQAQSTLAGGVSQQLAGGAQASLPTDAVRPPVAGQQARMPLGAPRVRGPTK